MAVQRMLINTNWTVPSARNQYISSVQICLLINCTYLYIFIAGLTSQATNETNVQLTNSNELTAINIAPEIKTILLSNAQNCKLRKKRIPNKNKDLSAPWFHKECVVMKNKLRKLGGLLKKEPSNDTIRKDLLTQKRLFKKLVIRKKNFYRLGILNEMTIKKSQKKQKDFWKLLDKLSPKKPSINNFPHDALSSHFKSLLNSKSYVALPPDSNERGLLDYIITLDELKKASAILKPGKALGIDNLSNEMILCLLENYPEVILK